MSMINRPFRGFSGTFTRPELPLSHPEIPLDVPVHVVSAQPAQPASSSQPSGSEPSASPVSVQRSRKPSQPTSTQDAASRPPHSRKPSSRLLRSISGIFAAKHTDTPSSSFRRKSKTCEATTPCKNSSNVIIYHGNHTFSEKEKAALIDETEKLYMSCYTKAERRHFFREAKRREGEELDQHRRGSSAVLDDSDDDAEHLHAPCPVHTTFELSAREPGAPSSPSPGTGHGVEFRVPQYGVQASSLADVSSVVLGVAPHDEAEKKEADASLLQPCFEPSGIVKAATWASSSTSGGVSAVFTVKSGYASSVSSFEEGEGEEEGGREESKEKKEGE